MTLRRVYVGLGANLGDAVRSLQQAAAALAGWSAVSRVEGSSLYRSAPVDSSGPDYWNAVLAFDTALDAAALHERLRAIESEHGRERPYRNAPRTLDLDLLAWGEETWHTHTLEVPHPRLHQRAFVLHPLLELAPDLALPGLGGLSRYLPAVADQAITRSALALWPPGPVRAA